MIGCKNCLLVVEQQIYHLDWPNLMSVRMPCKSMTMLTQPWLSGASINNKNIILHEVTYPDW